MSKINNNGVNIFKEFNNPLLMQKIVNDLNLTLGKTLSDKMKKMYQCPFHEDEDASFLIDFKQGTCHCFSCQTGTTPYMFMKTYLEFTNNGRKPTQKEVIRTLAKYDPSLNKLLILNNYNEGPKQGNPDNYFYSKPKIYEYVNKIDKINSIMCGIDLDSINQINRLNQDNVIEENKLDLEDFFN